mmetsp:Transcript_5614/g.7920  ORF Transcript_5614/g.7920 Transcript_5614/m.7920 type:complete len:208 (+) Transcript_5614:42-665(+)
MAKFFKSLLRGASVEEIVDKAKGFLSFRSEMMGMLQVPRANERIPGVPRIKGYRYPAPASQDVPNVPEVPKDKTYNISNYSSDLRVLRRESPVILSKRAQALMEQVEGEPKDPLLSSGEEVSKGSSPGNKNPAVLKYDPTGLRSAMSASWEAMDKSLESYRPLHLPAAEWIEDYPQMLEHARKHNLPEPVGRKIRFKYQRILRTAHW